MSKAVEGVTEKIEEYTRKEFKSKGYVDASLRTIAMEAGTTTGSIYSRYGGKRRSFSALVELKQQGNLRKSLKMSRRNFMRWRVRCRQKALMNIQEMG
ncbi:MAG: TetR/AcrR family transcriptional regulator [Lachnospira eligens]